MANSTHLLLPKLVLLFFWSMWFGVVFLTNLFSGLKAARTATDRKGGANRPVPRVRCLRSSTPSRRRPSARSEVVPLELHTSKAPALRAEVRLRLLFPGDLTVEARGVVAFTQDEDGDRPAGYGVSFSELADDVRELVAGYARQRDPVVYDVG